jgi:type 1 glutamine amidotransferase
MFHLAAVVVLTFWGYSVSPIPHAFCQGHDSARGHQESKTKILLLATPPDHPYGTHMYREGCEILAQCLRQNSGVEAVVCEGWPTDPKMLEGVRAIALYSGPGDFVLRGAHLQKFEELISQGVGFSAVHWSTGAMPDCAEQYKSCLGGYFSPKFGLNTTTTTLEQLAHDHPICRGWKNFELRDEIYLNPELLPYTQVIAKVRVPDRGGSVPKDHTVVWVCERPDSQGGRSLGCSLGHFHSLFAIEGLRRLLVNGILWTARVEIPRGGAVCDIAPSELELPPDPAIVAEVKRHDKNGDGDLDESELDCLVKDRIQKHEGTQLFLQVLDKDKDGVLSDEEMDRAYPIFKAHFLQQCRQGKVHISAAFVEKSGTTQK